MAVTITKSAKRDDKKIAPFGYANRLWSLSPLPFEDHRITPCSIPVFVETFDTDILFASPYAILRVCQEFITHSGEALATGDVGNEIYPLDFGCGY